MFGSAMGSERRDKQTSRWQIEQLLDQIYRQMATNHKLVKNVRAKSTRNSNLLQQNIHNQSNK